MVGGCAPGHDVSGNSTIQIYVHQQKLPLAGYSNAHGSGQCYGYPNNSLGYPNNNSVYPNNGLRYPKNSSGCPNNGSGYPNKCSAYPNNGSGQGYSSSYTCETDQTKSNGTDESVGSNVDDLLKAVAKFDDVPLVNFYEITVSLLCVVILLFCFAVF